MTDREIMQQVMENICGAKLCEINSMSSRNEMIRLMDKSITALRDRLAQPDQEPVAWMYVNQDGECEQIEYATPPDDPSVTPLYTAPRPWVGLTDEEREDFLKKTDWQYDPESYAVVIEAKLKEKNT
jgi:hypothetical protein